MPGLLGLNQSSLDSEPVGASAEDPRLMNPIDEQYIANPFYGSHRLAVWLGQQGEEVNRKQVQRLISGCPISPGWWESR